MIEFLETISYWYWLAFGLLLMLVEMLVPGVLFLWLGFAGIATGILLLIIPSLTWELQLVVFAVLSVVAIFAGRRFVYARQAPTDHPTLNRRGEQFVGQQYTLDEATSGGRGRLRIGDTMWAVAVVPQGADLDAGARVTVVQIDGATLMVQAQS